MKTFKYVTLCEYEIELSIYYHNRKETSKALDLSSEEYIPPTPQIEDYNNPRVFLIVENEEGKRFFSHLQNDTPDIKQQLKEKGYIEQVLLGVEGKTSGPLTEI